MSKENYTGVTPYETICGHIAVIKATATEVVLAFVNQLAGDSVPCFTLRAKIVPQEELPPDAGGIGLDIETEVGEIMDTEEYRDLREGDSWTARVDQSEKLLAGMYTTLAMVGRAYDEMFYFHQECGPAPEGILDEDGLGKYVLMELCEVLDGTVVRYGRAVGIKDRTTALIEEDGLLDVYHTDLTRPLSEYFLKCVGFDSDSDGTHCSANPTGKDKHHA
jgi:hypothetical protein